MKKLSIIVPCFNEEEVVNTFYEVVGKELEKENITLEFLFIDDGSKDKTLKILKELHKKDEKVRYISFARNFGKEAGVYAGLKECTGDYAVVMDADLQHDPKLLPKMIHILNDSEYETVAVRRVNRKGEGLRGFLSKMFFKFMNKLSGLDTKAGEMDYRMMSRKMIDAILLMSEYNRFSKGIFSWVGFDTKWLEQENIERSLGTSKWSFKSLVKYSLQGITAFSTMPLVLASFLGILFCIIAFIMIIVVVIKTLCFGEDVAGFPTLICCIFLIGGLELFCLGIIGEYLSKMYLEVKNRPIYIAKETSEDNE
ncbi:MAG: glycosyltransferase family 2 protein [Bacilli bacterium]